MTQVRYLALAIAILAGIAAVQAHDDDGRENRNTEVGAWFGAATPVECFIPDEAGGCPSPVVMMPQFLGDGTMVATDTITLSNDHLMGQGTWTRRRGGGIQATFLWIQPAVGPAPPGIIRVRLLARLDRRDRDTMTGTIQPFFFPFGPDGLPVVDPVGGMLPECTPVNGCFGTFEFTVRRIPSR